MPTVSRDASSPVPVPSVPPGDGPGAWVNDVHSGLSPTRVRRVEAVGSVADVVRCVGEADRWPIGVSGGRNSMGGQPFASDGVLLDTRALKGVLDFDPRAGTIEVEAGIGWPELVGFLIREQGDRTGIRTIVQKQTGADRMTLGGSLSSNIHGRVLGRQPLVSDLESFTLVDATGMVRRCSREENPEWFRLAVGGYGLFGVVVSVRLRLARREVLTRRVERREVGEVCDALELRREQGARYGDFQFAIDPASPAFLREGILSCYLPAPAGAAVGGARTLSGADWRRLLHLAHVDPGRAFAEYRAHYEASTGQRYWSDLLQFTPYQAGYHREIDRRTGSEVPASEVISELFVPRERLADFMAEAAEDFRRHGVKVVYGTVRLIEAEDETVLAWARRNYACVIFNLCTRHCASGLAHSVAAFRRLIDMAASRGGSYYLTYHRFATRDQVERCHPRFGEFLAAKRRLDPEGRFRSDWHDHYAAEFDGP